MINVILNTDDGELLLLLLWLLFILFDDVVVVRGIDDEADDDRGDPSGGKSTRNPGCVFKQNDITETNMKNTDMLATI